MAWISCSKGEVISLFQLYPTFIQGRRDIPDYLVSHGCRWEEGWFSWCKSGGLLISPWRIYHEAASSSAMFISKAMTRPLMAPNLACSPASPSTSRSGLSLVNCPHHKDDRVKAVGDSSYQSLCSHLFLERPRHSPIIHSRYPTEPRMRGFVSLRIGLGSWTWQPRRYSTSV